MKLTKKVKNQILDTLHNANGHAGGGSQIIKIISRFLRELQNSSDNKARDVICGNTGDCGDLIVVRKCIAPYHCSEKRHP